MIKCANVQFFLKKGREDPQTNVKVFKSNILLCSWWWFLSEALLLVQSRSANSVCWAFTSTSLLIHLRQSDSSVPLYLLHHHISLSLPPVSFLLQQKNQNTGSATQTLLNSKQKLKALVLSIIDDRLSHSVMFNECRDKAGDRITVGSDAAERLSGCYLQKSCLEQQTHIFFTAVQYFVVMKGRNKSNTIPVWMNTLQNI